ncbi:hypothetical protein SAMN06298216_3550 [Spirosomataceae bacterium TFI 002]|nr:hypothetical protein SAMN06298216_3550 [Spirosomataceae bacterium TFI 002]
MKYYKVYYKKITNFNSKKQIGYEVKNGLIPIDPFHDELIKDLSLIHLLFYQDGLSFTVITDDLKRLKETEEIILKNSGKGYRFSHVEEMKKPIAKLGKKLYSYVIHDFMCLNKGEKYKEFDEVLKTCNLLDANGKKKKWNTCNHPLMIHYLEDQIYQSISNRIRKLKVDPQVYLRVHNFRHEVKTLFPNGRNRTIQRRSVFSMSFTCNWELNTDLNWGQEVAYGFGRLVQEINE